MIHNIQLTWLFDWSSPYGNSFAVEPFCTSLFFVVFISLAWMKWKSLEPDVKLLFELDLDVFVVQILGFIEPFLWPMPLLVLWCSPFCRRWCDELDNCDDCRLPVSFGWWLFIVNRVIYFFCVRYKYVAAIDSRILSIMIVAFSNDSSNNVKKQCLSCVINCSFVVRVSNSNSAL